MSDQTVLVTGGTGFVGTHCIVQLLRSGYRVRTTVRSLAREDAVRSVVAAALGAPSAPAQDAGAGVDRALLAERLTVVEADLNVTAGWARAVDGCTYVLHVAGPPPAAWPPAALRPADVGALVATTRDGTVRVLRAARDAGVRRVVLTSSFAAVGFGARTADHVYTEADWSDPTADAHPDVQAKTLAERAAWRYIAERAPGLELAVVNPVTIFGPALGRELSSSVALLRGFLAGDAAVVPRVSTSAVDVRDVAELHLRAMTHPDARGERFLAVAGSPLTYLQIAELLRFRLGAEASRVPKRQLPDWTVSLMAPFVSQFEEARLSLGVPRAARNTKAREVLGWQPRSNVEAIVAAAESILALRLV